MRRTHLKLGINDDVGRRTRQTFAAPIDLSTWPHSQTRIMDRFGDGFFVPRIVAESFVKDALVFRQPDSSTNC